MPGDPPKPGDPPNGHTPPLKIFLLGGLKVLLDTTELPLTARRPRELLVWLALHPGMHDRATIAGALWPAMATSDARRNLRQALKALSDKLGPVFKKYFDHSRDQLGLRRGDEVWIDVEAVESLIRAGRLESAFDLMGGELVPDMSYDWVDSARIDHLVRASSLLEKLAFRAEMDGDLMRARELTARWLELQPVAEAPRRELIRRHAAAGDRISASVATDDLLALLRDQGLSPSPETRSVLQELHEEKPPESVVTRQGSRDSLLVELGSPNEARAIRAAEALAVRTLRTDQGPRRLPVAIEPAVKGEVLGVQIDFCDVPERHRATIGLEEARKLFRSEEHFLRRVLYAAFSLPTAGTEADGTIERAQGARLQALHQGANAVLTDRIGQLVESLRAGQDVALVGQSAAGKTVTAAQTAQVLADAGWTVSWLDMSEPATEELDLLVSLVLADGNPATSHLFVIDDIHANPGLAIRIGDLLSTVRSAMSSASSALIMGWDSSRTLIEERFKGTTIFSYTGEDVLGAIADAIVGETMSVEELGELRRLSGGDLLIARQALESRARTGVLPSLQEIAEASFDAMTGSRTLSPDATRLAYQLASLGQFEIEASRSLAEAASPGGLRELESLRVVRRYGDYVSVGHRSHATLMVLHLIEGHRDVLRDVDPPVRLALNYLRAAGDRQIVAMLQRLDLAGAEEDSDQHGAAFLARAWESIQILSNYLSRQTTMDATWGDNIASAIHAAQALTRFDEEAWARTASYVRTRWLIHDDGTLPEPRGEPSRERDDFDAICACMKEQDERESKRAGRGVLRADSIDFDRVHRTWVLGQLLGFEATAREKHPQEIASLKRAAQENQEPDGNLYPSRVPWVTARVVLGLAAAGESVRSSDTLSRACDWLRRGHPNGPYKAGVWEGGTGTWNSSIETTAMCLAALVQAGISVDDPAIRGGRSYLLSNRNVWLRPGAELDAANALETYILTGGRWREVATELLHLLTWARDKDPWTHTAELASESQLQSSTVALVANALIGILWETVKAELPLLLQGVAIKQETRHPL